MGRLKEVINKGGVKIGPSEIEHAALSHELVLDAVCFRITRVMYGEEIGMYFDLSFCRDKEQHSALKKAYYDIRSSCQAPL